jgi:peptidoglycan hydrolase-like protein with peptidoglycan-binding domain
MNDPIKLYADFDDDGRLIIEREDRKPISIITHEELAEECIEVLEINCTGHAVKALQCLLNAQGQHLEEDGIFGSMTQTALIIFQDQHQLPATGACDMLTWETLIRSKT